MATYVPPTLRKATRSKSSRNVGDGYPAATDAFTLAVAREVARIMAQESRYAEREAPKVKARSAQREAPKVKARSAQREASVAADRVNKREAILDAIDASPDGRTITLPAGMLSLTAHSGKIPAGKDTFYRFGTPYQNTKGKIRCTFAVETLAETEARKAERAARWAARQQ